MRELVLDKYTQIPKRLILGDSGMLECSGITIAEDVILFDAATDTKGGVHGVFFNKCGEIVYFMLADRLPVNKIMATCVPEKSLRHLSVDEYDGIMHIIILKNEKNVTAYHYYTSGNEWIKNPPKPMDEVNGEIVSTACNDGAAAILARHKDKHKIYFNKKDTWQAEEVHVGDDCEDVSITFFEGNIEIIIQADENRRVIRIPIEKFSENINILSKTEPKKEYEMANGATINSRFIAQLQENSDMIKKLDLSYNELKQGVEDIRRMLDSQQSLVKNLTAYRDAVRQYETQINHINIKIQELANRLNGFARQNR